MVLSNKAQRHVKSNFVILITSLPLLQTGWYTIHLFNFINTYVLIYFYWFFLVHVTIEFILT